MVGSAVGLRRARHLFITFIRPLCEYGIDITEVEYDVWTKIDALESASIPSILYRLLNKRNRDLERMRRLSEEEY